VADLAHAAENDTDLHGDPHAMHWAERFCSRFLLIRRPPGAEDLDGDDVGTMLTWFAGAIETGRTAGRTPQPMSERVLESLPAPLHLADLRTMVYTALGAASTCWESLDGTGEFDSARVQHIGDELTGLVKRFIDKQIRA
jgi:hypothetical protein